MKKEEIIRVLDPIIDLLTSHGHPDKANWLGELRATIADPRSSEDALNKSSAQLHGLVPGMGGLMDIQLTTTPDLPATIARSRLDTLADQLYELTR